MEANVIGTFASWNQNLSLSTSLYLLDKWWSPKVFGVGSSSIWTNRPRYEDSQVCSNDTAEVTGVSSTRVIVVPMIELLFMEEGFFLPTS